MQMLPARLTTNVGCNLQALLHAPAVCTVKVTLCCTHICAAQLYMVHGYVYMCR
jgi:hypothetical protein